MNGKKLWIVWGKTKLVFSQMTLYFSVVSITGVMITAWHTTISPILESYNITPSIWWLILGLGIPFLVLGTFEWTRGTLGFYQSFTQMYYTDDSPMKKDIEKLRSEIKELKELIEEGGKQ